MTPVLLFPGQSAFRPGLLETALRFAPDVAAPIVDEASRQLDCNLFQELGSAGSPRSSWRVQVGVFLANHLHLAILRAAGLPPGPSAGMSLGEYNHLVDIGAIDFLDALEIVSARGRLYDAGPAGVMAAIFPIEVDLLEAALKQAESTATISNYNSPTQQVIAGERAEVERVIRWLDGEHFLDARIIEEKVPMHSPWFEPVSRALRPHLERAGWRSPARPYQPNVTGQALATPRPEDIAELLVRHVYQPVHWRETMDLLACRTPDPVFIEVGPGRILTDLMRQEWRSEPRLNTSSPEVLAATLSALGLEVPHAG